MPLARRGAPVTILTMNRPPELPPLPDARIQDRRESVFLVLAGLFLGSLAMLNILGISRFIAFASWTDGSFAWGTFGDITIAVAVGVLPYPLTFLCTDLISELYGRRRASRVVWVGLLVNLWVIGVLWLGGVLPPVPAMEASGLPPADHPDYAFYAIRRLTFGAVTASMIAYLAAQFCDVYLFHFWKRLTGGRHLWLRNNGSTLVSQLVDTTAVILVTHFYAGALPLAEGRPLWPQLGIYIASGYIFKLVIAGLDTLPFYLAVHRLRRYLRLEPGEEAAGGDLSACEKIA